MRIQARSKPRSHQLVVAATLTGLLIALGSGVTVRAATPDEPVPAIAVRYDDLNLATDVGAHQLYLRIIEAARKVCNPRDADALGRLAVPYCQQQAIGRAVQAVGNPQLAALHATQGKRSAGHHYHLVSASH